ncbi:MAG TPA: ISKra4 family transposase, partial [Trueperaceae bacterium]|nr:ISKra4 family transposase [Trueperaceae bacterium]
GRALLRQLMQDHLDLRAVREQRLYAVRDAEQVTHACVEADHQRHLATVFGDVQVARLAYRARGAQNLYPGDAVLNLPPERHSHGLRRLAAVEAARGSYDDSVEAITRASGQQLGKRQVEQLAQRAAVDFDAFYATRQPPAGSSSDVLVLSCDGKGVVMRPGALRPPTAAKAAAATSKLASRLSRGEKRNRKRMAELGAVYDATPAARSPDDIMAAGGQQHTERAPGPVIDNKWLTASIVTDAAGVVAQIFDEAERRDPAHARTWVALVDGNNHQINRITAEARQRDVPVTILIDFVHVIEYLWKAAWCFHDEGDRAVEAWVANKARAVLAGKATRVAGAIRRQATTTAALSANRRVGADVCATYLTNKAPHLDYPTALASGWPIATGVIEGACRHIVADRLDITGARWGLAGAEAILKLRALRSNGDFDEYFRFHLAQERRRNHETRHADAAIPAAA